MSIWVWPVTKENWSFVKFHNVWSVNTPGKGKRVIKGDKIIFYVRGSQHFQGIFEAISDWYPSKIIWPDGFKGISDVDLKPIQLGYASLHKLIPSLEFIERKKTIGVYLRATPTGPANFGKPIFEKDYNLIFEELKKVQELPTAEEFEQDIDVLDFAETSDWKFIKERIHELPPPNLKNISYLISDIERGKYAIPIFQREFTWNRRQVEELWESIFQGFFVGAILTWNSHEQFAVEPVYGAPPLDNPTDIVLDGQQRITSLYYAVTAPDKPLTDVRTIRFFVDLKALLDPQASSSDVVVSYYTEIAKKRGYLDKEVQFTKKLFPLTQFHNRDYAIWLGEFKTYLEEVEGLSEDAASNYYKQIMNVLDHVWFQFKIPVVQLPNTMSVDSVAEVFEKINSKGTQLGVFDLLNARFTKYGINLRILWDEAKSDLDNILKMDSELGKDAQKFLLQAITLFKKNYCRRKELLTLDSAYELGKSQNEVFEKDWKDICKFTSKAIDKLTSHRESGFGAVKLDMIPYTVTIPVIAALLCKISTRNDRPKCLKKIETWYWCTVLSDSYSGSTDSKIEKDVREIQQWFDNDESVPETVLEQRRRFDEMNFNTARPNESIYKVVKCLISKKGALDFLTHEPPEYSKLDDHHIFPKSKEKEYGAETSINSILNKTLIDSETNRNFIRNQNPSDYLKEIMEKQRIDETTIRERLSTHLISHEAFDCLMRNDFNGFIEERRKTIRDDCRKLIFPVSYSESEIDQLLKGPEDQRKEFKSSLRWDMQQNKQNTLLEEVIIKELCGFMNSGGGNLIIGVDDGGKVIGLEDDYSTFKNKNSDDFGQHLTNLVNKYIDKTANSYFEFSFQNIDGKEICWCKIKQASRPVYVQLNNDKKFYVRMNNTCQPMDIEQAHRYISEHWKLN